MLYSFLVASLDYERGCVFWKEKKNLEINFFFDQIFTCDGVYSNENMLLIFFSFWLMFHNFDNLRMLSFLPLPCFYFSIFLLFLFLKSHVFFWLQLIGLRNICYAYFVKFGFKNWIILIENTNFYQIEKNIFLIKKKKNEIKEFYKKLYTKQTKRLQIVIFDRQKGHSLFSKSLKQLQHMEWPQLSLVSSKLKKQIWHWEVPKNSSASFDSKLFWSNSWRSKVINSLKERDWLEFVEEGLFTFWLMTLTSCSEGLYPESKWGSGIWKEGMLGEFKLGEEWKGIWGEFEKEALVLFDLKWRELSGKLFSGKGLGMSGGFPELLFKFVFDSFLVLFTDLESFLDFVDLEGFFVVLDFPVFFGLEDFFVGGGEEGGESPSFSWSLTRSGWFILERFESPIKKSCWLKLVEKGVEVE